LFQVRGAFRQRGFMRFRSTMTPKPNDATRRLTMAVALDEGPQFRMGQLAFSGMSDEDAEALRRKWKLKPGDVYDETYAQQFRRENGTPARRLSLEIALDDAKKILDLRIVSAPR
jgi:outer membrane protein assembly factor BamA